MVTERNDLSNYLKFRHGSTDRTTKCESFSKNMTGLSGIDLREELLGSERKSLIDMEGHIQKLRV